MRRARYTFNSLGAVKNLGNNQRGQFNSRVYFNCGESEHETYQCHSAGNGIIFSMATVTIVRSGGISRISANYFTELVCLQTNLRLMKMGMRMIPTETITPTLRRNNKSRAMRRISRITHSMVI